MFLKNFFARKAMADLLKEANTNELDRSLGLIQLICLGIGAIIGAGIFVIAGTAAAQHAGPAITLSFVLGACACICVGLCYAELASAMPISGSAYTFAYAVLGEGIAWFVFSMVILTYFVGAAAVASGWSGYVVTTLSGAGYDIPAVLTYSFGTLVENANGESVQAIMDLPAFLIVSLLTTLLVFGTEASILINTIIVIIKVAVLVLFVVIGFFYIDPQNLTPYIPQNTGVFGEFGWSGVLGGASIVFIAFNGFDAVSTAAQETKNPQKNLPLAIIISILICAIIYMLIAATLTGIAPYSELDVPQPMAIALAKMNMPWFAQLMQIGAIAALTSVVLVLLYGGVRVLYAVVHDGLLPKKLAKCHKKYHTPYILTILSGLIVGTMPSIMSLSILAKMANIGTMIAFAMMCYCTIHMRYTMPDLKREFLCPLVPLVPLLGISLLLFVMKGLSSTVYLYTLLWLCCSYVIYFGYMKFKS